MTTARSLGRLPAFALLPALALASATIAAPALAQDKTKSKGGDGLETMASIVLNAGAAACLPVVDNDAAATDVLEAAGWDFSIDDTNANPYYQELEGSLLLTPEDEITIWGFVEYYPGTEVGYCVIDYFGIETIGMDVLNADPRLTGKIEANDGGAFGSWTMDNGGQRVLVLAYDTDAGFTLQFTQVTAVDYEL